MEIKGIIVYDPVHRVSKKKELAVRRTHLIPLLSLLLEAIPHGIHKTHVASKILKQYLDRPSEYLATSRKRINDFQVMEIYTYLENIVKKTNNKEIVHNIHLLLNQVEKKLCRTKTHPWTAIVRVDKQIIEPFFTELKSQGITLTPSAWGPHVTWVKREKPTSDGEILWGFRDQEEVTLKVDKTLKTGNNYWWLDISCSQLAEYREELGLNKKPKVPFHLTIGKQVH